MIDGTLRSGICPKCASKEVYSDNSATKRGERMIIPITGFKRLYLDSYICLSCGYVEEWIAEKDLKDRKMVEKVKENWVKVE